MATSHAQTTLAEQPGRAALAPPLIRPQRHPITWTRQQIELLAVKVAVKAVMTYVGICVVASIYYLLFGTTARLPGISGANTHEWHSAVSGATLRHNIRDIGEGLLGGVFAIAVTYSHFGRHRKPNRLDRIEMRLGIPNVKDQRKPSGIKLVYGLLLVPLYAIPGFVVGELLVHVVHPAVNHAIESQTGSFPANVKNNFLEGWPKKLVGFLAALFFGSRPARAVLDDVQLWFVERRVVYGRPLRFYHPAPFKARYNELAANGGPTAERSRGIVLTAALAAFTILSLSAAIYGYYVLNYVAKHHTLHL